MLTRKEARESAFVIVWILFITFSQHPTSAFVPFSSPRVLSSGPSFSRDNTSRNAGSPSFSGLLVSAAAPTAAEFLAHCLVWSGSTVLFRLLLPPLQRRVLPTPSRKVSLFLDRSHEQFQKLSPLCWIVHVAGQALLSLVALRVLLPSSSAKLQVLGQVNLVTATGGGFLLASHALIEKNPFLEKVLDVVGTRIVRAAACSIGIGLLFPRYYALSTTILLGLSALEKVTFSNPLGKLLALLGVGMTVAVKDLRVGYKVAYTALFLLIPFLPDSKQDSGHTIIALAISMPYLFLLG